MCRDDLFYHFLNNCLSQRIIGYVRRMLRSYDHGINRNWLTFLIFNGDLRLTVRTEKRKNSLFPHLS